MASIDDFLIRQTFMINHFPLIESITENIFDGMPGEELSASRPITQTVQVISNFPL